jgi:hypothetical protein
VAVDSVWTPKSVSPFLPEVLAAGVATRVVTVVEVLASVEVVGGELVGSTVVGKREARSAASRDGDPSGAARATWVVGTTLAGGTVVAATDGAVVGAARSAASRAADPSGALDAAPAASRERSACAATANPAADATSTNARISRIVVGLALTVVFYGGAPGPDCCRV